jgi:phosphatidylserine decarboxylase
MCGRGMEPHGPVIGTILSPVLVPVNRAGWPFIAALAIAAGVFFLIVPALGWLGVVLTVWCIYFFRDPDRHTPVREGLIVSAADGLIQSVGPAVPPPELGLGSEPRTRISVFMSVFDVHVNRVPVDGTVRHIGYRPGRFFNASLDKASQHNERNGVCITGPHGQDIAVVQVAGLVARRIACWIAEGDLVRAGQRLGMIRLGSRVDVYLPDGVVPLVGPGQRVVAGETVLGDFRVQEAPRRTERR